MKSLFVSVAVMSLVAVLRSNNRCKGIIGAIVGKALGNLDSGTGTIPIMVTLR